MGKNPQDFADVLSFLEHCKWQEFTRVHASQQQPPSSPHHRDTHYHPSATSPAPVHVYQVHNQRSTYSGHSDAQYSAQDARGHQDMVNQAYAEGRHSISERDNDIGSGGTDLIYQLQQLVAAAGPQRNTNPPGRTFQNNRGRGGGRQQNNGDSRRLDKWCEHCHMNNHNTTECGRRTRWCDQCGTDTHYTDQCGYYHHRQQQLNPRAAPQLPTQPNAATPHTSAAAATAPPPTQPAASSNAIQTTNRGTGTGQGHLERVTVPPQTRPTTLNMLFTTLTNPAAVAIAEVEDEKSNTHPPILTPHPSPIFSLPTTRENNPLTIHGHIDDIPLKEIVVDTGSGITVISLRAFNMLSPSRRAALQPPEPHLQVQAANSSQLSVRGVTLLNITLGDKARLRDIRALVLDNLGTDCIVGNEHLQWFSHIDLKTQQLLFHDGQDMVSLQLTQGPPKAHLYTISLCQTAKIAPFSELIINKGTLTATETHILTEGHHTSRGEGVYLLEGVRGPHTQQSVTVGSLVLPFDALQTGRHVPILVRNEGSTRVTLRKGTPIAELQLISPTMITTSSLPTATDPVTVNEVTIVSAPEGVHPAPPTPSIASTPHTGATQITTPTSHLTTPSSETVSDTLPPLTKAPPLPDPLAAVRLDADGLKADALYALRLLLEKNRDCFAIDPKKPSTTTVTKHFIDTGNHRPIRLPPYRNPRQYDEFIEKEIEGLLANGLIEKSTSPWSFPVVVVGKKDGSQRLCIDFRKLNDITKMDSWPMPDITDLLDSMHGAVIFSSLDLASGYWQVRMNEDDKEKTAFVTRYGLYQWGVMPFGLATAPATFVRLMDEVFGKYKWKFLAIYFDDITVYSRSVEEHLIHLQTVFDRLRGAGLQVKASKCAFALREISFVGHRISAKGISPDPKKVEAVEGFPTPVDVSGVRAFLGLANFYRRFVPNFSRIVVPLTALLKKGVDYQWTAECKAAFGEIKQRLISPPILRPADFTLPFVLYTDASAYAVGAILGQRVEGKEHVIQYASRVLTTHERRYGVPQKEALAIVWSTRLFRNYLLGPKPFLIITDHAPLTSLRRIKDVHGTIGRWSLTLQEYNYMVVYRAGTRTRLMRCRGSVMMSSTHPSHMTPSSPVRYPQGPLPHHHPPLH